MENNRLSGDVSILYLCPLIFVQGLHSVFPCLTSNIQVCVHYCTGCLCSFFLITLGIVIKTSVDIFYVIYLMEQNFMNIVYA